MSTELERQFVEGAARMAYVMAWAEHEEDTCQHVEFYAGAPMRCTVPNDGQHFMTGHQFRGRSFAGQRLEDVAPPTPEYARQWAWKLLGALEEINPQWGRNLPSIVAAAHGGTFVHEQWERVRAFGSDIALMALGTGVSWFDDHANFELHVPQWDARGFELESVESEDVTQGSEFQREAREHSARFVSFFGAELRRRFKPDRG